MLAAATAVVTSLAGAIDDACGPGGSRLRRRGGPKRARTELPASRETPLAEGAKEDGHAFWRCSSSGRDRTRSGPKKATRGQFVSPFAFFNTPATSAQSLENTSCSSAG